MNWEELDLERVVEEDVYGNKDVYFVDEDGKIQGEYTEYTPEGKIMRVTEYKDNKKHGESKSYRQNGFCYEIKTFEYGILVSHKVRIRGEKWRIK